MTKPKDHLQKLEAKIRELVPELMELSFGCRIKAYDGGIYQTISFYSALADYQHPDDKRSRSLKVISVKQKKGKTEITIHESDLKQKIIGHPITLEHCRAALRIAMIGYAKKAQSITLDIGFIESEVAILSSRWGDLIEWESQTEVHDFLAPYLL